MFAAFKRAGLAGAAVSVLLAAHAAPAQDRAYVTNFRSGTLSIFPTDGERGAATLPLVGNDGAAVQQLPGENPDGAVAGLAIGGPVAVALSPDATIAYVVLTGSPGALLVVDLTKRRVAARIAVESEPFALAVSPGGEEVYVANFGSDSVSVVDAVSRRVAATLAVGAGPSGVVLSRARAYVTNTKANTVTVIDVGSREVKGEIEVGDKPFGLALTRDSLLVANTGSDSVSVVRTADDLLVGTIAVGRVPVSVAVSPDGKSAFVANQGDDSVSVIDTASHRAVATMRVGHRPFGVAPTSDGKRLLVANNGANTVSILDTETRTILTTVPVGTAPFGLAAGAPAETSACHCAIGATAAQPAWPALVLAALGLLLRRRHRGRVRRRPVELRLPAPRRAG